MLPEVKKEIINTFKRDFESDKLVFGRKKWVKMALENKELFLSLSDAADQIEDRQQAERFLRGAFYVYSMLDAQQEVDDLEKNWG
jgi:hypothetical protein|tara:strand:+ start:188 stop:442 length:255 start_codon:yes stop_codon:yes gene_type:complete